MEKAITDVSVSTVLNGRRARFVTEYGLDCNATQAAIRAGYSPKTARTTGGRLMQNDVVAGEIAVLGRKIGARQEITQERIMAELAKVAFSDIGKAVTWGPRQKALHDSVIGETAGVGVKSSDEIDADTRHAIAEISEGRNGVRIKLHDKLGALVKLGMQLGMFRERQPGDAEDNPLRLIVEAVQRQGAPLPIQKPNGSCLVLQHETTERAFGKGER